MPEPTIIGIAAGLVGSVASSRAQSNAAEEASDAQTAAAQMSIAEQRRQFDKVRQLLQPYVGAGNQALDRQMALIGMGPAGSQAQAVNRIATSGQMRELTRQGEMGILANASATGGLRGGDTQAALAQFRPQVLNSLIDQQYSRLAGLSAQGQNAAAGVGSAAQAMGNNVSQLYGQIGSAQAGNALAQGQAQSNLWGGLAQGIGSLAGAGTFGNFGQEIVI